MIFTLV